MSDAATLVVELFTEELPPKALRKLGVSFADVLYHRLAETDFIAHDDGTQPGLQHPWEWFATPRRLAVLVRNVVARSADKQQRLKLLPISVGLDELGRPTIALSRKLASLGLHEDAIPGLIVGNDGKVDALFINRVLPGVALRDGLQDALSLAIEKLPIPKLMSYARSGGYYNDVRFIRPAHRLLALHGADIVAVTALGLVAGRTTGGHRFLGRCEINIANALAYEETLAAEGKVIASFDERHKRIVHALTAAGGPTRVIMPDALLDEVTSLVEWPAVYAGTFDPAFLTVPQECLILTMQQNQKYFALADSQGKLANRFLLVSNIETADPSAVVEGNERVLRARLADAKFFYDQDRKTSLEQRVGRLANVTYHNQIGSTFERVARIRLIATQLATWMKLDGYSVGRAAWLCKADLVTDMVGEFPELQGLMGRYYAESDGESTHVARAIEQHYWPRFAGDMLPEYGIAQAVALADKLDLLIGLFGIGQAPTGDRDPFGLRRAALGTVRILVEKRLHLSLPACVSLAAQTNESDEPAKLWAEEMAKQQTSSGKLSVMIGYQTRLIPNTCRDQVQDFLYDRLRGYLRERGYGANAIAAVLDRKPEFIDDIVSRLDALRAFESLPESEALSSANKRIVNILKKSGSDATLAVDRLRLTEGAELALYLMFEKLAPAVEEHHAQGDFAGALLALAAARPVVDRFFDDVMVMADDPAVRANRLALLEIVRATMNRVADISKLAA